MLLAGELPSWYVRGFAFVLGAVWGSFANVLIYRWPREMSISHPASHCFACKAPIAPYDNVPIFAYLWLRGKCRRCGAKYSPRYAVIELIFALVSVAIAERLFAEGSPGAALPAWAAALHWVARFASAFALMVTAFIDLDEMEVPWFTKVYAVAPLAAAAFLPQVAPSPGIVGAIAGAALGYLGLRILFIDGYKLLTGRAGMGLGDAEVLILVGALLGLPGLVFTMGAGAVQGLIATGIAALFRGRIGPEYADDVEDDEDEEGDEGESEEGAQAASETKSKAASDKVASTEPASDSSTKEPAEEKKVEGEKAPEGEAKPRRRVPIKIPFVPFLALAALEYLLGADQLVNAYLRVFSGE